MRRALIWWAAAVALAVAGSGVLASRFVPRDPQCTWPSEEARPLDLRQAADRIHMASDLEQVRVSAESFGAAVGRRPRLSDSIDAQAGAKVAPLRARAWCETALTAQLANVHRVPVEAVRAQRRGEVDQADAVPASETDAVSSVVSRPLR